MHRARPREIRQVEHIAATSLRSNCIDGGIAPDRVFPGIPQDASDGTQGVTDADRPRDVIRRAHLRPPNSAPSVRNLPWPGRVP